MAQETHVERLVREGVLDHKHLDQVHIDAINSMSLSEVEALITFKKTLKAREPLRPMSKPDGTTDAA